MSPAGRETWGLAPRLLAATVAVVLVAAATAWAVAAAIGPAIFHDHMLAGDITDPAAIAHSEEAFRTASALSLAVALLAALLAAAVVSSFLTRRVTRSLTLATDAARRLAGGDHAARVPDVGMGREFEDLAAAFNTMATDLGQVESTRTRMLADLAHEMRTPVATLGAYLEAIADGVQPADAATLGMLRAQVTRLARLGEDVALVTTAEEGGLTMRRTPTSPAALVAAAREQAAGRYADRGVTLLAEVSPAARAATVDADVDRLGQVLTNLLDNALRHTPSGGRVVLGADVVDGAFRLSVRDDGEGIAPEHLAHVFDRFYRADAARDRAHGGSGVGLAIVRAIVAAHGGRVEAASAGPGRGATFTVVLPLSGTVTADR